MRSWPCTRTRIISADAAKLGIDVSPIDGNAIHSIIDKLAKMPPAELHSVQKLIEGG